MLACLRRSLARSIELAVHGCQLPVHGRSPSASAARPGTRRIRYTAPPRNGGFRIPVMRAVDVIRAKRDGEALSRQAIDAFVGGVTDGSWPDYQTSALLMAIVLRGMNAEETAWLTDAMVRSGNRVDLSGLPGIKVGKHSTGGVGDKVSIVLAPLAAACGVTVPKMSGRGLGHTGGTLDKLEAIPGFRVALSIDEFLDGAARSRLLPDQPNQGHRAG